MAIMVLKELTLNSLKRASIHIHFNGPITVIGGDSSTGKTYLIERLLGERGICNSPVKYLDKIVIITEREVDYSSENGIILSRVEILRKLQENTNKLIIIDNADMILPSLNITAQDLQDSQNQFLLFSRRGRDYGATVNTIGMFDIKDNTIRTAYAV